MIRLRIDHQDHPANKYTGEAFVAHTAELSGENHDDQHVLERIHTELEKFLPEGKLELIRGQKPKLVFYD